MRAVDALIAQRPSYAYFYELKGQILLEAGKAREAIAPLRQAVALAPHPGLIRIMLGQRRAATRRRRAARRGGHRPARRARSGAARLDRLPPARHGLSAARARSPEAELASAEGSLIDGDVDMAKNFARRAQAKLKVGSPGWLKADDIVSYRNHRPSSTD